MDLFRGLQGLGTEWQAVATAAANTAAAAASAAATASAGARTNGQPFSTPYQGATWTGAPRSNGQSFSRRYQGATWTDAPRPPNPPAPPPPPSSQSASSSSTSRPPAPASRPPAPEPPRGDELRSALLEWSVRQLKELASECGLGGRGSGAFLEKSELVEALTKHLDEHPRLKLEQITLCEICCRHLPTMRFWPLSCGHLPCEECLSRYLAAEAEKMTRHGKRHEISCMSPSCGSTIHIKDAVHFYRHLSKLWKHLGERERLMRDARHRVLECPRPGCVGIAYAEPGRRKAMCFMCEHQWDVDPSGEDPTQEAEFSDHVRKCPKCQAPIEKNGGCDHMQCSKCGRDFSWRGADFANPDSAGRPRSTAADCHMQ